jgi:hypothetical protein
MGAAVPPSTPSRPARRRVSRQRYLIRRIWVGTLAALLLLSAGFGIVKAIGALGGGGADASGSVRGAPVAAAGPSTTTTATAASVAPSTPSTGAPPETVASAPPPTTAPASTSTAAAATPPSAESPATVLVVGDSDAGTFGPYLKQLIDATGVARTTVDYKVSSGLARPDFYNWPQHLAVVLPELQPDIVVVTFGGNDAQGLSRPDGTNPPEWIDPISSKEEWTAEYSRRVGEVVDMLAEGGRTVIWVGIPNDDSPEMSARLAVQDEAVRAALATRPHVHFVDTWARFSSGNGGWAEYVVDPRDGVGKAVRASDGFHLNQNGAEILAVDIFEVVKADLRARGAQL